METREDLKLKIEAFLKEANYELIDIIYRREAGDMVLRLLVDRIGGGITIGECGRLSESIGEMIDESNLIMESYILEVASPGLDRPLFTDRDFERELGKLIRVNLKKPLENKSVIVGKLDRVEVDKIEVLIKEKKTEIPRSLIAKAVLEIEF